MVAFGRWAWKEALRAASTLRLKKVISVSGVLSISQPQDHDAAFWNNVVRRISTLVDVSRRMMVEGGWGRVAGDIGRAGESPYSLVVASSKPQRREQWRRHELDASSMNEMIMQGCTLRCTLIGPFNVP